MAANWDRVRPSRQALLFSKKKQKLFSVVLGVRPAPHNRGIDKHIADSNMLRRQSFLCMPGHEIVGRVIDDCRTCEPCQADQENYCQGPNNWLVTYDGSMMSKAKAPGCVSSFDRDNIYGGYSSSIVVAEDFVREKFAFDTLSTWPR